MVVIVAGASVPFEIHCGLTNQSDLVDFLVYQSLVVCIEVLSTKPYSAMLRSPTHIHVVCIWPSRVGWSGFYIYCNLPVLL